MKQSNSVSQPIHLDALDGLRGVAALVVVISHSANAGLLPEVFGRGLGQMGVALFYVLSGFLMGYLYLNRKFTEQEIRNFLVSRVARVLPLYYLVVLLAAGLLIFTGDSLVGFDTWEEFLLNLLLIQGTFLILWSVPVEVQFYIIFVVIWGLSRRFDLYLIIGFLLLLELSSVVLIYALSLAIPILSIFFWLHFFLCGLFISYLYHSHEEVFARLSRSRPVRAVALLAALLAFAALPELRSMFGIPVLPSFADPITAGYPILVFILTLMGAWPFSFLAQRTMRWFGRISFGLYLLHMPLIQLVSRFEFFSKAQPLGFIIVVSLAILLAWLARNHVELPAQSAIRRMFVLRYSSAQ